MQHCTNFLRNSVCTLHCALFDLSEIARWYYMCFDPWYASSPWITRAGYCCKYSLCPCPPPAKKKTQRDFCIATTSFWYLNSLPSSSWYLNRSSILHSPMPSPHVSQALAVYTKGTKAWFPDEQEGWVSATLQTSDVNDTNVKLVFVNDDDANRVIWALSCISKYIRLIDAGFLFFRNMFLQVPWQISRKPKGTICHPWGILQRWSVQKTWLT